MKQKTANLITEWFKNNKRDLPWRASSDPYAIWVSEVMLQQTQVCVVIDYFDRWMRRFPTLASLAASKEDEVIKVWEGLGYYRRAKMLRLGALFVMEHFDGCLPSEREKLLLIPGIGPYTAGAILLFAFKQRAIAVDGNVERVICRLFGIEENPKLKKTSRQIERCVDLLTPDKNPHLVGEGLIELGALICGKKAKCEICPLKKRCRAYQTGSVDLLPNKKQPPPTTLLFFQVFLWICKDQILLCPPERKERFGELYTFPKKELPGEDLSAPFEGSIALEPLVHFFTRFKAMLIPWVCPISSKELCPHTGIWVSLSELGHYSFSSGERAIKNYLSSHPSFC